jgi:hypothetical protein
VAEREALGDAIDVGLINHSAFAEAAQAFGVFGLSQVAAASAGAQDFTSCSDLEPFGHGFFGLDAFWTSHKSISYKKDAHHISARAG